jgi:hypothetical protein
MTPPLSWRSWTPQSNGGLDRLTPLDDETAGTDG